MSTPESCDWWLSDRCVPLLVRAVIQAVICKVEIEVTTKFVCVRVSVFDGHAQGCRDIQDTLFFSPFSLFFLPAHELLDVLSTTPHHHSLEE